MDRFTALILSICRVLRHRDIALIAASGGAAGTPGSWVLGQCRGATAATIFIGAQLNQHRYLGHCQCRGCCSEDMPSSYSRIQKLDS